MKKRRPCSRNQNRSPANSPRAAGLSSTWESISSRSKRSQDLRKRHSEDVSKQQRKLRYENTSFKFTGVKKKNTFSSLESLFDIKRPLKLPEVPSSLPTAEYLHELQTFDYSDSESDSFENIKPLITNLPISSTNLVEQKPNIHWESGDSVKLDYRRNVSKLEELELDIVDDSLQGDWNNRGDYLDVSKSYGDMADVEDQAETEDEQIAEPSATPEDEHVGLVEESVTEEIIEEEIEDAVGVELSQETAKPPAYPIPTGFGEGVPPKPGGHRESTISSTPLTDNEVIKEMMEADQRCKIVDLEMKQIRDELNELKLKEDLTDEDVEKIQEKQVSLMSKMQEFDEITRKIQRLLGVADPSSQTMAKMFEMLPYPHTQSPEIQIASEKDKTEEKDETAEPTPEIPEIVKNIDNNFDGYRFDLPQPEYPEDKLPRVVVCGYTEDKIPRIVIPDSRPRSTRCLKNLTGKLSESLNMQEKLVQENAKLEGGKYKLEEDLLEKDNTLDCLLRKVCGLQAEIRIVVKENTELSRQLALRNRHHSAGDQACSSTYTAGISSRSNQQHPSSYSEESSPRQDNGSCRCNSCIRDRFIDSSENPASTICVNPEVLNLYQKSCGASPRLSGGGSREGGYFISSPSTVQEPVMSCRGPTIAKVPGTYGRPVDCPAEIKDKPATYPNNTKQLAQQLDSMESELRNMQIELANVHREREQLEQQRKLLKCTEPCAPCSCCPPGISQSSSSSYQPVMIPCVAGSPAPLPPPPQQTSQIPDGTMNLPASLSLAKMPQQQTPSSCAGICVNVPMGTSTCPQQQLRDLREQYARLQEDYKNKLCEVSCLRTEAEKMRQDTREAKEERERAENRLVDVQERLKSMESEKLRFHGSKEQMVEQEQALLVAKQRYREAQDELEELRSMIQDQANQLEDYRNKYLQAQEQVEEQRRQLDLMEMDNARMNENVTLEIGRVKNQFQEKLAELAPLPDILKQTQTKLQEVQQMRMIAERNCEDLSRELLTCKDKIGTMHSQLIAIRNENSALQDEKGMGSGRCEELEKKNGELRNENERMKNTIARSEELESQLQKRVDEKMHEVVQLTAMLEQVREDSARQVARTKERCETVRRTMQGQIAEMEKQLAQCRATARAAQKDRDEIRQKMQGQINNLNEAFEQAQGRIRSLQGHVNYLKTSYSNIFSPGGQGEPPVGFMTSETGQGQGYDSCDCNY